MKEQGVNFAHINLQDICGDSALPINRKTFREIDEHTAQIALENKLFYEYENKYWFTSGFKTKIENTFMSEQSQLILKKMFAQHSHYQICSDNVFDLDLYNCFDELNVFLNRLMSSDIKMINGEVLDVKKLIKQTSIKLDTNILINSTFAEQ